MTGSPAQTDDAIVVGAGPAGAMAALQLARRGHRVTLLDRHAFPRDKVCGDALIPDSIRCLRRAGLYETVRAHARENVTCSVYSPGRIVFDVSAPLLTIKRFVFDHLLVTAAIESGAQFVRSGVVDVNSPGDGAVTVRLEDGTTRSARVAILASGANIEVADKLGAIRRRSPNALALRCYVRSRARIDRLIISYDRAILPGYAWIFPLPNDEFNVGCGCRHATGVGHANLRSIFERFVSDFPLAADLMAQATEVGPLRGAMLRCGLDGIGPQVCGRVLIVGETIGTTYPLTGEGIGKAMETGELAADVAATALDTDRFDRLSVFERRMTAEIAPKFRAYRVAERWMSKPWLIDLFARRIRASRRLQAAISGVVEESVDPRMVFSLGGLARSLLG